MSASLGLGTWIVAALLGMAQEAAVPGPLRDDFEADANRDGIPDGWFNIRDHALIDKGGAVGPRFLRFSADQPGRPSKAHRGLAIPSATVEAIVVTAWVRAQDVRIGESLGEAPGIAVDFLGDALMRPGRANLTGWDDRVGKDWVKLSKRFAVPAGTNEALVSIGLMGATGTVDFDGFSLECIPRGGVRTDNFARNGDFELGAPDPPGWSLEGGAKRVHPGYKSDSALELARSKSRALMPLPTRLRDLAELQVGVRAKGGGLRNGGAVMRLFFLDKDMQPLSSAEDGVTLFRWSGSFDWRAQSQSAGVPSGAAWGVLQVDKTDGFGTIRIDDIEIRTGTQGASEGWTPDHEADDTGGWFPYVPAASIVPESALDVSKLLQAPASRRVVVKDGSLRYEDGALARFFGVALLPPVAIAEPERTDALVDRLARSGVDLIRLADLDTPIGPGLSLIQAQSEDTKSLDPDALDRLHHLIRTCKGRGIAVTADFLSSRRFRSGDGLESYRDLPLGGGPAAAFDPKIRDLALDFAAEALGPFRDDPALAWATLSAEHSLFDLLDTPHALPTSLRQRAGSGARHWQREEGAWWPQEAALARAKGFRTLFAGCSHWRREPEFGQAQATSGLDLIDDRLYLGYPRISDPMRRGLTAHPALDPAKAAAKKRREGFPYAVGQWCERTDGAWANPYEGAGFLLTTWIAARDGYAAIVRRGVFLHPSSWGAAAPGTSGIGAEAPATGGINTDMSAVSEALNANPQLIALLPHAATLFRTPAAELKGAWNPERGSFTWDAPRTCGLAGWSDRRMADCSGATLQTDNPYAILALTSPGTESIPDAPRVLVTAVARAQPTGMRWADAWRGEVSDPGRPPIVCEPVRGAVVWKRAGSAPVRGFALDNAGNRIKELPVERGPGEARLVLDGSLPALHYELVAGD